MTNSRMRRLAVVVATTALMVSAFPLRAPAFHETDIEPITVWQPGGISPETVALVVEAAARAGARFAVIHRGTIRLERVERDGEAIQTASPGFSYPMSAMALDPTDAGPLIGGEAAAALADGLVVFAATSAAMRGAIVGDSITFLGWDGSRHHMTVGAVVDDLDVDYAELTFAASDAAVFGFDRPSSVAVWELERQDNFVLTMLPSLPEGRLRINMGTDADDPDSVLPTVLLKERFGEFSYKPTGRGDGVTIDPEWKSENIVNVNLPLLGPFRCHRAVVPYLRSVVDEIQLAGLGGLVSFSDFQTAGGCYNARLIRGGDKGGAVSRHTWGVAIDINPSQNRYGGEVNMHPDIVEIFRKWGFAWGGGWTYTDGGHFEWTHLPTD